MVGDCAMPSCGLVNLGACLPEAFFRFLIEIINAPLQPFLQLTLNLLSEPINLGLFFHLWVIVIYCLSMFYALLLLGSGFNFMIAGYDSEKREKAKMWFRNTLIMIVLVQASFFIYQLALDLSAAVTSGTLSLINPDFFLIGVDGITDLGMALFFGVFYLITLLLTALVLTIRYAVVAIGVVLLPLGIFFYFIQPLKAYGSLILNVLGVAVFVTFFDALLLAGFSRLIEVSIFSEIRIIILIAAFLLVSVLMLFLMLFSVVKASMNAYHDIKRLGGKH